MNVLKKKGGNENAELFIFNLSREYSEALKLYCQKAEMTPESFIREAVVKELLELFVDFGQEEYVHINDNIGLVKSEDYLKDFFKYVKQGIASSKLQK